MEQQRKEYRKIDESEKNKFLKRQILFNMLKKLVNSEKSI